MKLNLGSRYGDGSYFNSKNGWTSVDYDGAPIIHDLRVFPWPFETDSIEAINASHVLEHLKKDTAYEFLRECYRILQPGGTVRIAVPDMDKLIRLMRSGIGAINDVSLSGATISFEPIDEQDVHGHNYMYCFESLAYMMEKTGFVQVEQSDFNSSSFEVLRGVDTPLYKEISLYVDAAKQSPTG